MQLENTLEATLISLLSMLAVRSVMRYTPWIIAKLFYPTSLLFLAGAVTLRSLTTHKEQEEDHAMQYL